MDKGKPGKCADFHLGNIPGVKKLLGFLLADFFLGFRQLNLISDV